jgi:hypothetical protein
VLLDGVAEDLLLRLFRKDMNSRGQLDGQRVLK